MVGPGWFQPNRLQGPVSGVSEEKVHTSRMRRSRVAWSPTGT